MSEDNSEQEPSIEEILSSIRQIISDDDEDEVAEAAPEPEAPPEPEPTPEPAPEPEAPPEPEPEDDDEILELTDKVDDGLEDSPEAEPEKVEIDLLDTDVEVETTGGADEYGEELLTDSAEGAAYRGFSRLASDAPLDRRGTGDTTVEDIVRELMKPMLREWLDVHLPPLIERVVKQELRKVAKRAASDE